MKTSPPAAEAPHKPDWAEFILKGGKIGSAVGTVAGFVGDFIRPLGPCNLYITGAAAVAAILFGVSWVKLDARQKWNLDKLVPQQAFAFTTFLLLSVSFWVVLDAAAGDDGRGVVAGNVPALATIQDSLLGIQRDVAVIRQDVAAVKDATEKTAEGVTRLVEHSAASRDVLERAAAAVEGMTDRLDEIGGAGGLVANPRSPLDWLSNADVLQGRGDLAAARKAYDGYFEVEPGDFIDAWQGYFDLLRAEFGSDIRGREIYERRLESRPGTIAGRIVLLASTPDEPSARQLRALRTQHPDYLPLLPAIAVNLDPEWTIDFAEYLDLASDYQRRGGPTRRQEFLIRPADESSTWAATLTTFGKRRMPDLTVRLVVEVSQSCGPCDMTVVAVGIADAKPPRAISLCFPDADPITFPLGPKNPAGAEARHVIFELDADEAGPVRFTKRDPADRRACGHVGTVTGIGSKPVMVGVEFVDARGRTFRFPEPVPLAVSQFEARIVEPRAFDDRGPLLQITSIAFLSSCEVAARKDGPYIGVPMHEAVPTIREIPLSRLESLGLGRGASLWIRGRADATGRQLGPEQVTIAAE